MYINQQCNHIDVQKGVTLIELIVFITVSGIIVLSLSAVFRQSMVSMAQPALNSQMIDMALYQLNTVLSHRFDEASPEDGTPCDMFIACRGIGVDPGENRNNMDLLDDVDDFNGIVDVPRVGFSRSISVSYAGAQLGIANQYAKRIDINVTENSGASITLSAYKINQ